MGMFVQSIVREYRGPRSRRPSSRCTLFASVWHHVSTERPAPPAPWQCTWEYADFCRSGRGEEGKSPWIKNILSPKWPHGDNRAL